MYMYHPHRVFLADYGWFERKILHFNTQICIYHILFTDDGTTDYIAAENFDGIDLYYKVSSELVHSGHSLLICFNQVSIDLIYFSPFLTLHPACIV